MTALSPTRPNRELQLQPRRGTAETRPRVILRPSPPVAGGLTAAGALFQFAWPRLRLRYGYDMKRACNKGRIMDTRSFGDPSYSNFKWPN